MLPLLIVTKTALEMQVKVSTQVANPTLYFRAQVHTHSKQSTSAPHSTTGKKQHRVTTKHTGLGSNPCSPLLALQSQRQFSTSLCLRLLTCMGLQHYHSHKSWWAD